MRSKKLKINNYMEGALIATLGIVISKILGIIYVIPFYSIIGEQGGALYGYAYNIYSIFLGISSAGIPLAISKLVSEYNTLELYQSKEKVFRIAKTLLTILGIICFLVLVFFADGIAQLIIGDIQGGNSIEDIVYVIRVIAVSILVVPILSVYRGYLQGHRFMSPTSVSQVLEQFIRVMIIIIGSFLALKVFHLSLKEAVGIALLGATIGAIISTIYLVRKVNKNKDTLQHDVSEEKIKTTKEIIFQIFLYAFPFIFSDVCKSLYNSVDTFFVVKTLVNDLSYPVQDAEAIMGFISTWGNKLNMIVIAIGTGFMSSLIPNLTISLVKKDRKDINLKINQTLQILILITLPMTVGLSFLAEPVWNIFYGTSYYGPKVFSFSIFTAFVTVLLSTCTTTLLTLKEYKYLFLSLLLGLGVNALLDVPLMHLLHYIGLPGYYGATLSTILGNVISILAILLFLVKKYEITLKETVFITIKIVLSVLIMYFGLWLIQFIIPFSSSRMWSFCTVIFYAGIGAMIYFMLIKRFQLIDTILGDHIFIKIKRKFKR
ncbi:MAG: polysaccharide biosynthesis protein [bacterium]|nr:polysaccharide biosynthesis protein [bacterium]